MLAGFHPGVIREIKKVNKVAFEKLEAQYNDPALAGLKAMHELMLPVDHHNKIHTKEANEMAFCLPSRVRELRDLVEETPAFQTLFEKVPQVVKDIYNEFPDLPGETQRYKFTKVVQAMFQFATVSQAAEAAYNQIQYEAKLKREREWTQEQDDEFWDQKQAEIEIIGKHCPRDQNHIFKATRTNNQELKKQFQEQLKELKGSSGDYVAEWYTSTTTKCKAKAKASAKAPPPGAPAASSITIQIASRAQNAQLAEAIELLTSSASTENSYAIIPESSSQA